MKRSILLISLLFLSICVFAQVKKDTTAKPKYGYFIKVNPKVFEDIMKAVHEYRDVVIYSPLLTANQKINLQAGIDQSVDQLNKQLKIDSAILPATVTDYTKKVKKQ